MQNQNVVSIFQSLKSIARPLFHSIQTYWAPTVWQELFCGEQTWGQEGGSKETPQEMHGER